MTRLLVSVRDRHEAEAALQGGADVIDLKDPEHGSLGACNPAVWREVGEVIGQRLPLSAAFGELRSLSLNWQADDLKQIQYAKVGLSGCGENTNWETQWADWCHSLSPHVRPVAVAYADRVAAQAPPLTQILERAVEMGSAVFLVDTFVKDGRDVFSHQSRHALSSLFERAGRAGSSQSWRDRSP